jgi:hypothetical protein
MQTSSPFEPRISRMIEPIETRSTEVLQRLSRDMTDGRASRGRGYCGGTASTRLQAPRRAGRAAGCFSSAAALLEQQDSKRRHPERILVEPSPGGPLGARAYLLRLSQRNKSVLSLHQATDKKDEATYENLSRSQSNGSHDPRAAPW